MGTAEPMILEWLLEPDHDRPVVPVTLEPALEALYFEVASIVDEAARSLITS